MFGAQREVTFLKSRLVSLLFDVLCLLPSASRHDRIVASGRARRRLCLSFSRCFFIADSAPKDKPGVHSELDSSVARRLMTSTWLSLLWFST